MQRRTFIAALPALTACAQTAPTRTMNTLTAEETAQGWQLLFDGQSLTNWQASDAPGSFSVKNGAIVVKGPRSHLFYMGPVADHDFRNFELKIDVLTFPKANSGVYFHTEWQAVGWPSKGYEVQVNNSHSDPSRTGGLWGVRDFKDVVTGDHEWLTLVIRVQGKRVVTTIDGKPVVDYTEEANPPRGKGLEQRLLKSGTFALQGHDPGSEVHFRNIKVRLLG
jgi:hypothetical protein